MKFTLLLACAFVSLNTFAVDQVRNETRTRIVGEKLLKISKCSAPEVSSFDHPEVYLNKNNEAKQRNMTTIRAITKLDLTKCQISESYMVAVTGSGWFAKASELQGTTKQVKSVVSQSQEFVKSQDLNMKGNQNNDGLSFNNSSPAQLVLTLSEGLKSQVQDECDKQKEELATTITDTIQDCK
jgi:uncharacterized Zn-finger protein